MDKHCRWTLAVGLAVVVGACGQEAATTEPQSPDPGNTASITAKPSGGSVSVTMSAIAANCDVTVTYTWSGLSGRNLIATLELVQVTGTNLDIGITAANFPGVAGRSGSVSNTFQGTVNGYPAGRTIYAVADLVDSRKFHEVTGSAGRSSNRAFSTCSWP